MRARIPAPGQPNAVGLVSAALGQLHVGGGGIEIPRIGDGRKTAKAKGPAGGRKNPVDEVLKPRGTTTVPGPGSKP